MALLLLLTLPIVGTGPAAADDLVLLPADGTTLEYRYEL